MKKGFSIRPKWSFCSASTYVTETLTPCCSIVPLSPAGGVTPCDWRRCLRQSKVSRVMSRYSLVSAILVFYNLQPTLGHYTHALTLPQRINLALSSVGPTALLLTGLPYIPFYLVTAEFFAAVRAHMRPEGLLMMNLFDNSPKHGLLVSTVATLERVFPRVVVLSVGYGNR